MTAICRSQQTVRRPARVSGHGYWSGQDVTVEFHPAPPGAGLTFTRVDLPGRPRLPALARHRVDMPRRTALAFGGASVEMVEHVLAALAGLRVDNCDIQVTAAEMPGLDGSSAAFVTALREAGVVAQPAPRATLRLTETVRVGDQRQWVEYRPLDATRLVLEYRLEYPEAPVIGAQTLALELTPDAFERELSAARTFLLKAEADWMRRNGLGRRVTCQDLLVFDDYGPIDNTLRFADECVRHKTLDLVGDLALAGRDIAGSIVAYRSGHRLNAELVGALLAREAGAATREDSAATREAGAPPRPAADAA